MKKTTSGYTIIELVVVIAVIAILSTLGVMSFNRVQTTSRDSQRKSKAILISEALEKYYDQNGEYPSCTAMSQSVATITSNTLKTLRPDALTAPKAANGTNSILASCADLTAGGTADNFAYVGDNGAACRTGSGCFNYQLKYYEEGNNNAVKVIYSKRNTVLSCPTGFIVVPGSRTYNTSNFCVMKYEAKNVSGIATSQAASTPWVSISQTSAITTSSSVCNGCHLLTEAEWLTIAQNVLSVPSNWSGGAVGSGYIYSGHNNSTPNNALSADIADKTGNQKRTLTLTNGEVIWDFAGNVAEWVANNVTGGQPGANTIATYSQGTPGTYNWTVPAGVTSVTIEAWGAPGGTGAGLCDDTVFGWYCEPTGGSGGSGGYAKGTLSVSPTNVITAVVGANGLNDSGTNAATDGEPSYISLGGTTYITGGGGGRGGDAWIDSGNCACGGSNPGTSGSGSVYTANGKLTSTSTIDGAGSSGLIKISYSATADYQWNEWTALTIAGTLSPSPYPKVTALSGASTWNSAKGIGQIYSTSLDMSNQRCFIMGGAWNYGANAGVLSVNLGNPCSYTATSVGFRVAK